MRIGIFATALIAFVSFSGICGFAKEVLDYEKSTEFALEKAEEISKHTAYDYEKYPWLKSEQFQAMPKEVAKLVVREKILGEDDQVKKRFSSSEVLSMQNKNYIVAYYVVRGIVKEGLDFEKALATAKEKIINEKLLREEDVEQSFSDAKKILAACNVEEIAKETDAEALLEEAKKWAKEHEAKSKPEPVVNDEKSEEEVKPQEEQPKVDVEKKPEEAKSAPKETPKEEKVNTKLGIESTRENYKSGKYVTPKGKEFSLNKVEKAKNLWEILAIPEATGDMDALQKAVEAKLKTIHAKFKTEVMPYNGSCQQAIRKAVSFGKTAAVSFANGRTVAGGVTLGLNGQEESLVHCIPGLYESLLENAEEKDGMSPQYVDVYHSPEVGLYSENTKMVKTFYKGQFYSLNVPIDVNIISSAAINFGKPDGYKNNPFIQAQKLQEQEPYVDMRRRIKTQLAMAIIGGNEVLVTGIFGCGRYAAKKKKISTIYQEELANPLFKDKLKLVVLSFGDTEPYSSYDG